MTEWSSETAEIKNDLYFCDGFFDIEPATTCDPSQHATITMPQARKLAEILLEWANE